MKIKRIFTFILPLLIFISLIVLLFSAVKQVKDPGWVLAVNTALSQDDPMYKGLQQFKKQVESRTGRKVKIRIFVGSQLGSDEDVLEQARAGANVAVLVDGGRIAVFVPEFGIMGAPYIANGYPAARKIVTSDLFEQWVKKLHDTSSHQVLSFNWWQGERHMLTQMPISTPADLNGLRIRTIGAPVWIETIRAMGATPTPLAWAEVYSALQQKVIDGAEAQHPGTYNSRFYEVTRHITKTGHINLITGLVVSAKWFDSLPPEYQHIVREEALIAGDLASRLTEESLQVYEDKMRAQGVTITEIDKTPFIDATLQTYEILGYTELRKQVLELLKQKETEQ